MATTRVERAGTPAPSGEDLLRIDDLETQFHVGSRIYKAVNKVSLDLEPGECLGLIGESGSGKSVTALSVMGLVSSPPGVITGGAVRLEGKDLIGAPYELLRSLRGRKVAYIFQDPLSTLHPLYRIGDQLIEAIRVHEPVSHAVAHERAVKLLADVRIPNSEARAGAYPHELSGGMRQRVGIAMALANDPDIIIADEPTTALDVTVQAQILDLMRDLQQDFESSIVMITHNLGVVSQMVDDVAVMYRGKVVEKAAVRELFHHPAHPYTVGLLKSVPVLGRKSGKLVPISGMVPSPTEEIRGCAFAARCPHVMPICREQEPSLQDVQPGHQAACWLHPSS
jgi:peptide/nickel transport system permease protein